MELSITSIELPLAIDEDDVWRIAKTRIRLETVLTAFEEGATPEEIVQDYPPLALADIYAVISYYLQNQAAVTQYLQQRTQQRALIREDNEARWPQAGIRARLLQRQAHAGSEPTNQRDAA